MLVLSLQLLEFYTGYPKMRTRQSINPQVECCSRDRYRILFSKAAFSFTHPIAVTTPGAAPHCSLPGDFCKEEGGSYK